MAQETETKQHPFKARIDRCKARRRELVPQWQENIDYRRGTPFASDSDEDRINVNLDWSYTKAKHATIFSAVPEVRLTPKYPEFQQAVAPFGKQVNETLKKSRTGAAVNEAIDDCINAAGVGVVEVAYRRRTRKQTVPTVDQITVQQMQAAGQEVPTQVVDATADQQFIVRRISPADFLWPTDFTGSDFDDCSWLGHSGVMTWAEAKNQFNLKDEDKDRVTSGGRTLDTLKPQDAEFVHEDADLVHYDEIFYYAYRFDADEQSFHRIKHLVFVQGLDQPVIDGDWSGQKFDTQSGTYSGSCKFPIRVLTLTYISDDPIPPSDSAMGRPQVNEILESRTQQQLHRKRSIPIRGFDPNRVDPEVATNLMRGTWNGWVPVLGNGQGAIWEIAQAQYPQFDVMFDNTARRDLTETWSLGPNQQGNFNTGTRSASEAQIVESNAQTRANMDRAAAEAFFLGIAEVVSGLLALYGNFELNMNPAMQGWDRQRIANEFVYDCYPDSTVLLNANQKFERLSKFLNMTGQSGVVNVKQVVTEMGELLGLDPAKYINEPMPAKPEQANISLRLTGAEDLTNPLVLAFLMQSGQAPTPESLEAAKQTLMALQQPPQPPQEQVEGAEGPDAAMAPEDMEREEWNAMPKVVKRADYQ